jgi:hypothetical protein
MRDNGDTELNSIPMSSPDLIEFHVAALALAILIQAKGKSDEGSQAEIDTPKKRYLAQPIAQMTKGDVIDMINYRVDKHMEGYLFRIERLEQTAESYGARIKQLEVSRQPPEFVEKRT